MARELAPPDAQEWQRRARWFWSAHDVNAGPAPLDLDWDYVKRLRDDWSGPLLIKGLVTREVSSQDRRARLLHLTRPGMRLLITSTTGEHRAWLQLGCLFQRQASLPYAVDRAHRVAMQFTHRRRVAQLREERNLPQVPGVRTGILARGGKRLSPGPREPERTHGLDADR